jgi:glucosyltransferase Lgt1/2/3
MTYTYHPDLHIKIWLSDDPNSFLNLENQIRLIQMREKNPRDRIHFIFDSELLTQKAVQALNIFCKEHTLIPIDAHKIQTQLRSEKEHKLYQFYKDELHHLKTGGNLAVASDILRWLSPIFKYGTYTDFDVPIDTSHLPSSIIIDAPLLLNIGSLHMGKKEFILANNDFLAIVDAQAESIERVQSGILARLKLYDNDFVERTEEELIDDNFLYRQLMKAMRNRSDIDYIAKSKKIRPSSLNSSLNLRSYINEVMSDPNKFLDFNKLRPNESNQAIVQRLRKELHTQLNWVKFLFFNKEYCLIKTILEQEDHKFLTYLMRKERDLYLKSIVVCTTGPIELSNALFNAYVLDEDKFIREVQPLSFNHYGLQKAFRSQNSIPLHEHVFGMLKFLGLEGEVNDSSWLPTGKKLQTLRTIRLMQYQKKLAFNLPSTLLSIKKEIELSIQKDSNTTKAHEQILNCFNQEKNEFDIIKFKNILINVNPNLCAEKTIKDLNDLCHEAVLFSLAKEKKLKLTARARIS